MDADRPLKGQQGQALLELLLLAPFFLALLMATAFFVHALNARLTLIQTCRDTALGLARDEDELGPQGILQAVIQERGIGSLGHWSASLSPALPDGQAATGGALGSVLGSLIAERLSVTLDLPLPRWLPGASWQLQEKIVFKRDAWKRPYAKAIRSLMDPH